MQPQLHLPGATPQLDADPRSVRERLVARYLRLLHDDERLQSLTKIWRQVTPDCREAIYGGPPSILFLNEAERLLRERLDTIGVVTLRMLAENRQSQARFLREVIGDLYSDYLWWHKLADDFDPEGAKERLAPAPRAPARPGLRAQRSDQLDGRQPPRQKGRQDAPIVERSGTHCREHRDGAEVPAGESPELSERSAASRRRGRALTTREPLRTFVGLKEIPILLEPTAVVTTPVGVAGIFRLALGAAFIAIPNRNLLRTVECS